MKEGHVSRGTLYESRFTMMVRVLCALAVSYLVVAGGAFVTGLLVQDPRSFGLHFILGLLATLFSCLMHCIVLTYFVITGKMIKQAVLGADLDPAYIQQSQRPKVAVVRLAMAAVAASLGAALLGAWANVTQPSAAGRATLHMTCEILAVVLNLWALLRFYHYIYRHTSLLNEVFDRHRRQRQARLAADDHPTTGLR